MRGRDKIPGGLRAHISYAYTAYLYRVE
jgi:hypothetical protein